MKHLTTKWLGGIISLLAFALTIGTTTDAYAVPAKKGVITMSQPDGSTIRIRINGDEHFHWKATEAGYPIVAGEDGFYYYAQYDNTGKRSATSQRVSINGRMMPAPSNATTPSSVQSIASTKIAERIAINNAATRASGASASKFPSIGKVKSAIILIEFPNLSFSIDDPNTAFHNQLNEEGYSVAGATGSARDYYLDNSKGQFDGQFDVYGPYKAAKNYQYYGGDSGFDNIQTLIIEAAKAAHNDGVDFSEYDLDNNGEIDNIFVYYAGYNAAEGGPEGCIYPHKSNINSKPDIDGKKLSVYACTSELRGNKGVTIAGIGTFCHEFGHVFGLVDVYDTDYAGNGGTSPGVGTYCIMCEGAYNNNGNTPPLFNALAQEMIGWNIPKVLTPGESITARPIQHHDTYMVETEVEGEFFLIENRNKESIIWEKYLPSSGLLITHIDRSNDVKNKWANNTVNVDPDHDCIRFVPAGVSKVISTSWDKVPFPYENFNSWTGTTGLVKAASWAGVVPSVGIINITRNGAENISFNTISNLEGSLSIVITKEFDEYYSYVGDELQLNVEVLPEGSSNEVTWSSNDESVATVSESGEVVILSEGEVVITATSQSDATQSGSITLHTKTLNGLRGTVDNGWGDVVEGATLSFYAVTKSVVNQVETYTRSSVIAPYRTKTDSQGRYRADLAEGLYEVEISKEMHYDTFDVVEVTNGVSTQDFSLNSHSDTIVDLDIQAGQVDATISWNPKDYSAFRVILSGDVIVTRIIEIEDSTYEAEDLKSNREYTISIEGIDNGEYTNLYKEKFSTLPKITTLPIINIPNYDDCVSAETNTLKALNVTKDDVLTWFVDGTELRSNKVNLSAGEHTIKLVVDREGEIFTTTRFINVQ